MADDAQEWEWVAAAEMNKRRAAEARVAELERENDDSPYLEVVGRLQAAEARVAELLDKLSDAEACIAGLEEALREIDNYGTHFTPQTAIARRALAHEEEA